MGPKKVTPGQAQALKTQVSIYPESH